MVEQWLRGVRSHQEQPIQARRGIEAGVFGILGNSMAISMSVKLEEVRSAGKKFYVAVGGDLWSHRCCDWQVD